jgi:Protein of unknown function (DUF3352)
MTDHEPHHEYAHDDGGSAAFGEQAYGGAPTSAQPPHPSGQPAYGVQPPTHGAPPAAPGLPFGGDILAGGSHGASRRRLAPVITSVGVVLAIVLGGGAFTAMKLLASSGSQPDKWAPANSIAFFKLDLDPSASAKVAAWEFEQKFPQAPKIASADQLKDGMLDALFNQSGGDVDYATDIKPWLGDRVAVDAFLDSTGAPQTIGILQVKDAAKAQAGLTKLAESSGAGGDDADANAFSIQGGYAILGDTQSIVNEAVADAKKANIDSNATYTADVAKLASDRVMTGWWDAGATLKAVASRLPAQAGALLMSGGLTGLPDLTKAGRFVMGLRVQPTYAELQGRILGSSASSQLKQGDAGTTLGNLPSGTIAGVSLANPEQLVKTELGSVQKGLAGQGVQNEMDQIGAELGVSLPGDIENLLGSELAVGIDALPPGETGLGDLLVTAITHPDDLGRALQTAKILLADAGPATAAVKASTSGSSLVVTDDSRSASGKLADDPGFRSALDGMPSQAVAAGFVDLSALVKADPEAPAGLSPLQSLGFYVGTDANSPVFAVRLTVS